jgi:hypothetical protein
MTDKGKYLHKSSKEELRCDCPQRIVLIAIEKEWDGGAPAFGKVMSMTPAQRSEVLKKRAKVDFKKNIEEKKREMNKSFNKEASDMIKR